MINPWVYLNHSSISTNCSPLQPSYRTNGIGQTGVQAVILNSSNISSGPCSGSTLVSAWWAAQDHIDTNLHNHESWLPFSHAQHCFYYREVGYGQKGNIQRANTSKNSKYHSCFQCKGCGFDLGQGTKIPHTAHSGKKKLFLSLFSIYLYFCKSFGKHRSGIFQVQTEVLIRD